MLIAVPLFQNEVSPRFGCCRQFLFATVEDNQVVAREVRDSGSVEPWHLVQFLVSQSVERVICGGINRRFLDQMHERGIKVTWGVIGTAEDALAAFLEGTLRSDQFVCPGPGPAGGGRRGQQGPAARPGTGRRRHGMPRAGRNTE